MTLKYEKKRPIRKTDSIIIDRIETAFDMRAVRYFEKNRTKIDLYPFAEVVKTILGNGCMK